MPHASSISPAVVVAKEGLAQGREKLRRQHEAGSPGVQVCTLMTELVDEVILALHAAIWSELPSAEQKALQGHFALVAHSGFGRREMAPYSDVDLMFLYEGPDTVAFPFYRKLSQTLYDLGVDLGLSVRKVSDIPKLIHEDITIFTALAEARFLTGSEELHQRFEALLMRCARWHAGKLVKRIEHKRQEERTKFGETVYLLEPNVKRSRGGQRNISSRTGKISRSKRCYSPQRHRDTKHHLSSWCFFVPSCLCV